MNIEAIYLKNPDSSRAIDIKEIDMNNTKIFNGFNVEFEIKILKYSSLLKFFVKINIIAATKSGIQNVSIENPFIFRIGNFNIHTNIEIIASAAIIIV